jgi:hypothetical protein
MLMNMKLNEVLRYLSLALALVILPTVGQTTTATLTGKLDYLMLQDARTHKMEPIPFLTDEDTGDTVMLLNVWPDEYPKGAVIKVMGKNKKDYFEVDSVIVISGGKPPAAEKSEHEENSRED